MGKKQKREPLRPKIPEWIPRRPGGHLCEVCRRPIETMAFKGTGVCSGNCEKKRVES